MVRCHRVLAETADQMGRLGRPVFLENPFPVVIFYTTVLAATDGTVSFYDDIYGHDEALAGALAAGYPYPP